MSATPPARELIDCRHSGGLEHLRPFLLHGRHEGRELGWARQLRAAAELDDAGFYLRTRETLVDHAVELGDDLRGRAGRRDDALPGIGRHAFDALLLHGR